MEDHLLELFGGHDTKDILTHTLAIDDQIKWDNESLNELKKIPGFVRGKVKRNIEKFAKTSNLNIITTEVMYAAKEQGTI